MTPSNVRGAVLVGLWVGLTSSCDEARAPELSREPAELEQPRWGTWPPPGGTLNTAWLGTMPLMRLMPPDYQGLLAQRGDQGITAIDIARGGQYETVTSVAVSAHSGALTLTVHDASFTGAQLVDSRWWLDDARSRYIAITDYELAGGYAGYQFTYFADTEKPGATELCEAGAETGRWAYVVGDVHVAANGTISPDDGALLIACASGALGKAITWGFSPWARQHELNLSLYQTGVRTVMADYCGTGSSHTEDGTQIQVSNARAHQSFSDSEAATEAVFGPNGALCLSDPRITTPGIDGRGAECLLPRCGDDASTAAMMDDPSHTWTKHASLYELP